MKQARVPAQYLPVFCRELYQMVRSGLPISEGLAMLRDDETDREVHSWLETLCQATGEGMPLSAALRQTEVFPAYMNDMVALAEETGRLENTLLALQRHYDRQNRMMADIRNAVAVPMALLVVLVAVVVLLVTQVLPVFDQVFAQLGVHMGVVATGMMQAGAALAKAGTGIAIAVAVLACVAVAVALIPALRTKFSGWFRYNFGGRGILGQMAVSRFASSMAMGVSSGLSMEASVEAAAHLCGGAKAIDQKTQQCLEKIEAGGSPAKALAESGLFAGRDCLLLQLAEKTGALPETLEDLAQRQEEESVRRMDRRIGAIEPTIVVITSILAGVILLSVMLPLMGLLSAIG